MISRFYSTGYDIFNTSLKWLVRLLALQAAIGTERSYVFGAKAMAETNKVCPIEDRVSFIDDFIKEELTPANFEWMESDKTSSEKTKKHSQTTHSKLKQKALALTKKIKIVPYQNDQIITPTEQVQFIQEALVKLNNMKTLQYLVDSKVTIRIVPEDEMAKIAKTEDFSACFIASPYNFILLNEHVFTQWSEIKKEQLITLLANEISHALINHRHLELKGKMTNQSNEKSSYAQLVPWLNEHDKKKFTNAYDNFLKNVETYKKLLQQKKEWLLLYNDNQAIYQNKKAPLPLTEKQTEQLSRFDHALEEFIPPRFGKNAYNVMQERIEKNKDGKITLIKNIANQRPSLEKNKERLEYLKTAFFHSLESKKLEDEISHQNKFGIYGGVESQVFADLISDFESFSPQMRLTFGEELCRLLDDYFEVENHCERPWWPKI